MRYAVLDGSLALSRRALLMFSQGQQLLAYLTHAVKIERDKDQESISYEVYPFIEAVYNGLNAQTRLANG